MSRAGFRSGDVVVVDLGVPAGSEAGFPRPAIVVTAQSTLDHRPTVLQVVPCTRTLRGWLTEIEIEPDEQNGLEAVSAAQCQHIRSVSTERCAETVGTVGPLALAEIRELLADLFDL